VDLDQGTLEIPPVVGEFTGKRGEFYNQQIWEGRSTFHLSRRAWNNRFQETAARHGK
jgi:hypothetical protein